MTPEQIAALLEAPPSEDQGAFPALQTFLTQNNAVSGAPPPVSPPISEQARGFYDRLVSDGLENAAEWLAQRDAMAEATGHPYYPVTNPAQEGAINWLMQSPVLDTLVAGAEGYMNELGEGSPEAEALRAGFAQAGRYIGESGMGYLDPRSSVPNRSWGDVPGMEDVPAGQILLADAATSAFDLGPFLMRGTGGVRKFASPTRGETDPSRIPEASLQGWIADLLHLHNQSVANRASQRVPEAVEGVQTASGSMQRALPDALQMILESDEGTRAFYRNSPQARDELQNLSDTLASGLRATFIEGRGGGTGAAGRARLLTDALEEDLVNRHRVAPEVASEVANEIFRRGFGAGRNLTNAPGQGVRQAAEARGYPNRAPVRFDPLLADIPQSTDWRLMQNVVPDFWSQREAQRNLLTDAQSRVRQAEYGGAMRRAAGPSQPLPRDYDYESAPLGSLSANPDAYPEVAAAMPRNRLFEGMDEGEAQEAFENIAEEGRRIEGTPGMRGGLISTERIPRMLQAMFPDGPPAPGEPGHDFVTKMQAMRNMGWAPYRDEILRSAEESGLDPMAVEFAYDLTPDLPGGQQADAMERLRQRQIGDASLLIDRAETETRREQMDSANELIRQLDSNAVPLSEGGEFQAPSGRWGVKKGTIGYFSPVGDVPEMDLQHPGGLWSFANRADAEPDTNANMTGWVEMVLEGERRPTIDDAHRFLVDDTGRMEPEEAWEFLTRHWPDWDGPPNPQDYPDWRETSDAAADAWIPDEAFDPADAAQKQELNRVGAEVVDFLTRLQAGEAQPGEADRHFAQLTNAIDTILAQDTPPEGEVAELLTEFESIRDILRRFTDPLGPQ